MIGRATFMAAFVAGAGVGAACGGGGGTDCPTGSNGCACTPGGGCDPGNSCIDGTCVSISSSTGGSGDGGPGPGPGDDDGGPGPQPTGGATTNDGDSTGDIKLDLLVPDVDFGDCAKTGCRAVDMLFAIDSSLSMIEEIEALSSNSAAASIVEILEQLNCGAIDYRIGLTNDNDGGFIGAGGMPWFDSQEMTSAEISAGFSQAAGTVLGNGGTALGCEHVLSSARALLVGDTTGFLRPEALLVLVLVTDVDDYGAYDQMGFGGPCDGFLCAEAFEPVEDILGDLVTLKGGDAAGVAAVVIAGDPGVTEGMNLCEQPASCCGVGMGECAQALHGTRLWDFAAMLPGTNGVTVDICQGAEQLPAAIETALGTDIDLACQTFEPEG
jgi:hypothetical protein